MPNLFLAIVFSFPPVFHPERILPYVLAVAVPLVVCLILTPFVRRFATRIGMVDQPDARRVNTTPIPRGGGLGVVLAVHVGLAIELLFFPEVMGSFGKAYPWFLAASLLLAAVGFVDDWRGMRAMYKLAAQIAAASILFAGGIRFHLGILQHLPDWLRFSGEYFITVFWVVGAINAFNLIDGLDGLATGLACIASVGMAGSLFFANHFPHTLPYLVLLGAGLGFLRYNFNPASIFLGDTGSMFLGLTLATLPLVNSLREEAFISTAVPMLAMGVPIADTALAILRRSLRALINRHEKKDTSGVMEADKEHIHHRLLAHAKGIQKRAVYSLYGISVVLVLIGSTLVFWRRASSAVFLLAFMFGTIVLVRHMVRVELWDAGRILTRRFAVTKPRRIVAPFYMIADVALMTGSFFATQWLLRTPFSRFEFLEILPLYIAPTFVLLVLAQTYRKVWSRALVRDYFVLAVVVGGGGLVTESLRTIFEMKLIESCTPVLVFCLMLLVLLPGIRIARVGLLDLLSWIENLRLKDTKDSCRVLVYGGGGRFRSYLRSLSKKSSENKEWVIGLVDEDINLRGTIVCGHTVLGTLSDLKAILHWKHPNRIVFCAEPSPLARRMILQLAAQSDIPVYEYSCGSTLVAEERGDI